MIKKLKTIGKSRHPTENSHLVFCRKTLKILKDNAFLTIAKHWGDKQ